ncbi:MAG TPA: alpha/beta hydrolase [Syntrophales bacterium]|nr:alpha/beta hydrolase [Syntrophales bacterium]HQG34863.1 alpha/beta hydrolase [Syntrophales bacterium]
MKTVCCHYHPRGCLSRCSCWSAILIILVALSFIAGCATPAPRLQPSGLNTVFAAKGVIPFEDYISQTREMMLRARVDIHDGNRELVLHANLPFERRPDEKLFPKGKDGKYRRGVLLIHGLSDSPYMLQPLARHFQSRGFIVRTILLPGHGTVPGDLLDIRWQEWYHAVQYGIRSMQQEAAELYLGGFSTGAALSVLSVLRGEDISGLVLISPALAVKDRRAALAGVLRGVKDWVGDVRDDADYAKYETFAVNAAYQIYLLTAEIDALFAAGKRIEIPVFAVLSAEDVTVDADRAREVFQHYAPSEKNVVLVYARDPQKPDGPGSGKIYYEESYLPERRILDFSHVALPLPCDDPHYGLRGGYKSCLHYAADREKRQVCRNDDTVWQGEISAANLQSFTMRRLTCNPKYDGMLKRLDGFLRSVAREKDPGFDALLRPARKQYTPDR